MPIAERVQNKESQDLFKLSNDDFNELTKIHKWLLDTESHPSETLFRSTSKEDYAFYAGDQDTAEVKALLIDQKRPATVYNEIKPKVDMLIGMAAQNKFEPDIVPVGTEDTVVAQLMNGAIKHYKKRIKLPRKEHDCSTHAIKSGRSLLYFYIDKENPFTPKICCKRIAGYSFMIDPDSVEYDLSDARFIFLDKWVDEEQIKGYWPDIDVELIKTTASQRTNDTPEFYNISNEKYRLVECWYRKYVRMRWFINPLTNGQESLTIPDYNKLIKLFKEGIPDPQQSQAQGMQLPAEQQKPQIIHPEIQGYSDTYVSKIYYMIFCDFCKIEGGETPYKFNLFPAVLFGAYKDDNNNKWFSVITMMKDPQRALNTCRRQLSHLIQTLPKGILIHEVGAILDVDAYEKRSADPTYHMEVGAGKLDKVRFEKQPSISPIYSQFDEVNRQGMKDSSGIQNEMMGLQTTSREPGVTVRMRQETNLAVLYIIFDNFKHSRLQSYNILMHLIQQYCTEEQMIRIEGQEGAQLIKINSQMNPQVKGFNDITTIEFDLDIDEVLETSSSRLAIAQMLTDFAQNNPGSIPPDIMLEFTNIPFTIKQKLTQIYQQQQEAAAKQQDITNKLELAKIEASVATTQIAANAKSNKTKQ